MGIYGTPPVTRTDSSSGQLIFPPHRYLFTRTQTIKRPAIYRLKLVRKVIKETLHAVHPVIWVVGLLVCHPDWAV